MTTVISKDGTKIAFDKVGTGPAVVLVSGALSSRASGPFKLAELLASQFTVYSYDRRGRNESSDTLPYAVQREVEDLEAIIDDAGGSAYVYGHSSGAALALESTLTLGKKITKLALYEAPYNADENALKSWKDFGMQLDELLAAGHRGGAVALFLKLIGMPDEQVLAMRETPVWSMFESIAPTLAYDNAVVGQEGIPTNRAAAIAVPTLVLYGGASYPFMKVVAEALSKAIPHAELRALEGQNHNPKSELLAPVLLEFFGK